MLALPSHSRSWFSPCTSEFFELLLHLRVATGIDVTRVACGPLGQLCRFSRTLRAPDMSAFFTDSCCGRIKQRLALVAGASDSLFGWVVCQLVSRPCHDCEDLLPLRSVRGVLLLQLVFWCLLLRVSRTLLATLVVTLQAHFLSAKDGSTTMAAAMDAHADRLLDTLYGGGGSGCSDPFMRFECEAVLGEECAGSFLLHGIAVNHLERFGWGRSGNGGRGSGSSRSLGRDGTAI